MYLRYLQYFITVAEYRNFSRAAEKLNTVQPSISRQIKRLEEIVGTALFVRSPNKLELTKAGEVFLEQSRLILNQFETAKNLALEAAQQQEFRLEVGLISGTEVPFYEHVVVPGKTRYPELDVHLNSKSEVELVDGVINGSLDMGFLIGPVNEPELESFPVCRARIAVTMPENNPLAQKERLYLKDIAGSTLYIPSPDQAPYYAATVQKLVTEMDTYSTHTTVFCDCVMLAMQSVGLNKDGICFVSDFQGHFAPKGLVVKELCLNNNKHINCDMVVVKSRKNPSTRANRLLESLRP